jgi:GNAT superfamily N-acetyltransferase
VRDRDPEIGHLDLLVVDPAARRRGTARALVTAAERALAELGITEVRIAGNDPCDAWPGIDVRYTRRSAPRWRWATSRRVPPGT